MQYGISRVTLKPMFWADGNGGDNNDAGSSQGASTNNDANKEKPGQRAAGSQTAGQAPPPENNSDEPDDDKEEKPELTPGQNKWLDNLIASKIAADRKKQDQTRNREQAQQQAQQAKTDGDLQKALDAETTLRTDAETRVKDLEAENATLKRQNAVIKVAAKHSLPAELVEMLEQNSTITDEATAEAAAKKLAKFKPTQQAPETDAGSGNRPASKQNDKSKGGNGKNGGSGTGGERERENARPSYRFIKQGDVEFPD
jgi:hypothetical protein